MKLILRLPLSDINNQPFAPIPFGGIYCPLQCDPKECNKAPLCLTYDAAHFSSLVAMDHESYADRTPLPPAVIPLVDWEGKLLPVQFIVEPMADLKYEEDDSLIEKLSVGERDKISLLAKYLDLVWINKETKEVLSNEQFKKQQNQKQPQIKEEQENKIERQADERNESSSPNPNKLSVNSSKLLNSKNLSSSANLGTPNNAAGLSARRKKSFNFGSLSSLTQKFSSLKRSVSKKFRRNLNTVNANINNLARRSSFRLSRRSSKLNKSESQTKSTNNLETNAVSNISLNSPATSKSPAEEKASPSKSSGKSPIKSAKSPSKSVKSVSSSGSPEQAELATKPEEESIIPDGLVLAAELHLDKLPSYRDEFIRNYLATARFRFLNECDSRSTTEKSVQKINNSSELSSHKGSTVSCASSTSLNSASNFKEEDFATQCMSNGSCPNFGKSSTNYLCEECFISQKKELIEIESTIKTKS